MTRKPVNLKDGELLHVETPLGIVNIRAGLTDGKGQRVDSIEILPNNYAGEPTVSLDGYHNNRMIENTGTADRAATEGAPR